MRNLRTRLLTSHLVLVAIMGVVMTGAVVNFFRLGRSIDRILRNNYKSVVAAQDMKQALERQDSAATFLLAGQPAQARLQFQTYAARFEAAYQVEAHNITEPGEQQMADDIQRQFATYHRELAAFLYAAPPLPAVTARAIYFSRLEPGFVRLTQRAQDVLDLNQAAIVRADERAKRDARSVSLTAVAVTLAAFTLALCLAAVTVRASLAPLRSLALQAEEIGAGRLNQRIELQRTDEIGALAESFNHMAERLRQARKLEGERLRRAERMSDAALESLYDPVLVTDSEAQIVYLNPAAEGLFGSADALKTQEPARALGDPRISEAIARAIHQEHVTAAEDEAGLVTFRAGEATRTYRLRVSPMRDEEGGILGAAAVLEDITHLRELDRLKTEFIAVASHELRTPVTSLLLSVQLMEAGAVGRLTPEQAELVRVQRDDVERLDRMMRELLEMTRLEAGVTPPRFEITKPAALVSAAIAALGAERAGCGVPLLTAVPDDLPMVRADPEQAERVLVNLLTNALRHTPASGRVEVTAVTQPGCVRFEVRDTGAGIPPEYLARIFERFVQVPGATRGGTGLGLSIARMIVRAHHGEISATSTPGEGSVFSFTLPVAETKGVNDGPYTAG
ncbi:MAG: HAMP domain-containing protein [Armatimonadetes bacterium]|nr:HAMP domain-containing protein [Armatimonadota bacterium]MDE2207247.1 HAMP domain-containing protein [Armatimonadota bacterium]